MKRSLALLVAGTALALPVALVAVPAAAGPSGAPSAVSAPTKPRLPEQARTDLKQAWQAPDGQRVAALQDVLDKALAGDYGAEVKPRAARLSARIDKMDSRLKKDLAAAIELPREERRAALREIRIDVRSGDYGDQARRHAQLLRRLAHR